MGFFSKKNNDVSPVKINYKFENIFIDQLGTCKYLFNQHYILNTRPHQRPCENPNYICQYSDKCKIKDRTKVTKSL